MVCLLCSVVERFVGYRYPYQGTRRGRSLYVPPVRTECGMFVMYCMQCCMSVSAVFVVHGCGVSRRYIDVCYCDIFSVVNVYLGHLKFCVVCINCRRYVCCSECDVVSNECNEPTSCLVQLSVRTAVKLCILCVLALGVSLVS